MKRIIDNKGTKQTIFNSYELKGSEVCPECGRALKEYDLKMLEENGKRNCPKCGAKLIK